MTVGRSRPIPVRRRGATAVRVRVALGLAGLSLGLTLGLAAGTVVFGLIDERWSDAAGLIPALAFGSVGSIIATKRSDNPIGWLFCAVGAALAGACSPRPTATTASSPSPDRSPEAPTPHRSPRRSGPCRSTRGWCCCCSSRPDMPPSRRWRPVVWLQAVGVVMACTAILEPGPLEDAPFDAGREPARHSRHRRAIRSGRSRRAGSSSCPVSGSPRLRWSCATAVPSPWSASS